VETGMLNIPAVVENVPIVPVHSDMKIEGLFREWSPNGCGPEFPLADELRNAFWEEIPVWKKWNESEATKIFLEWFRFASFMKAEPPPNDFDEKQKQAWWAKNVATTEAFLRKYGSTV
jgi:hypothetical protein